MLAHWHIRSVLLSLLVLTYAAAADDTSGLLTYRTTVSQVRVTFFATDENNHPVAPLTKADFAVVDDERVVRNFRSFTPSDEISLDVVALVDASESVAPRFRVAVSDVLQLVVREPSILDDNIAVLSFGGTLGGTSVETTAGIRPAILCASGCRASDSVTRLLAVKSSGSTPLFDALLFATDFISHHRRAGTRQVLILFSDGNDTISLHSPREALEALVDGGALVYSVDMGTSENQASIQTMGSMFLRQVSEATGGRYFPLHFSKSGSAAAVLNAVLEDLRASYVVTDDLPSHQVGTPT